MPVLINHLTQAHEEAHEEARAQAMFAMLKVLGGASSTAGSPTRRAHSAAGVHPGVPPQPHRLQALGTGVALRVSRATIKDPSMLSPPREGSGGIGRLRTGHKRHREAPERACL